MIYFCDNDEEFIIGVCSVNKDVEKIASELSNLIDLDLYECESTDFDSYTDISDRFENDTIIITWNDLSSYLEDISEISKKNIDLYVVNS